MKLFTNIKLAVLLCILSIPNWLLAQRTISFISDATNITSNYAVMDVAELNNNPNAVFSVRLAAISEDAYPNPLGVWYTGQGKWSVFHQDLQPMQPGVSFIITISENSFIQTANAVNTTNHEMYLDHPSINGNRNARFTVTQNWNPGGTGGVYNNSKVRIFFNESLDKWVVANVNTQYLPAGATFNVVEWVTNTNLQGQLNAGSNVENALNSTPSSNSTISPTGTINPSSIPQSLGSSESPTSPSSTLSPVGAINPAAVPDVFSNSGTASTAEDKQLSNVSDPAIYDFLISKAGTTYPSGIKRENINPLKEAGDGFKQADFKIISHVAENLVFNPQRDVLFAGSIIQSEPYYLNNRLTPIQKPARAGTITLTGGNGSGSGSVSRNLTELNVAAYQDAVRSIIQGLDMRNSSGNLSFNFKSCRSVEQGLVEAGLNFKYSGFTSRANISSKNSNEKSYVVGVVVQKYYTVSYTPPSDKRNIFLPGVSLSDLRAERLVSETNRPVYISQVDYGRMFILIAESEAHVDSLKAAMEANYAGTTLEVGGNFKFEDFKNRYNLNVTIFSVGSNNNAEELNDFTPDAFKRFLQNGGTASLSNPGAPISFMVRDLISGTEIPTMLTADYSELYGEAVSETYTYIVKPGNCPICVRSGLWDKTSENKTLKPKKGDIIQITATGRATHGPWLEWDAKGPNGQPGERTDNADPLPCIPGGSCLCNRYALIANIPNPATGRQRSCVGEGANFIVAQDMVNPLGFTFNDYNTTDGEGFYTVTVKHTPYMQVVRERIAKPLSQAPVNLPGQSIPKTTKPGIKLPGK